jgi:hypothetical protein
MHSIDVARFQAEHSLSPSKRGPKPSEAVHEHYRRIVNSVKRTVTVIVGDADEVRKIGRKAQDRCGVEGGQGRTQFRRSLLI